MYVYTLTHLHQETHT